MGTRIEMLRLQNTRYKTGGRDTGSTGLWRVYARDESGNLVRGGRFESESEARRALGDRDGKVLPCVEVSRGK